VPLRIGHKRHLPPQRSIDLDRRHSRLFLEKTVRENDRCPPVEEAERPVLEPICLDSELIDAVPEIGCRGALELVTARGQQLQLGPARPAAR